MLRDILLVEDNPGDVALTRAAFEDAKLLNPLVIASDGEQAVELLRTLAADESAELPAMILLDLNLPKINGREVLAIVKDDPRLRKIPVIVLTSSAAERDIAESYQLGVNAFVTKPLAIDEFLAAVRSIGNFWLTIATLPPEE
jgi:CheY-like chemotaxis protein